MGRPENNDTSGTAKDLRAEVRRLDSRCDQLERMLHQRDTAYDTLIRAGAAGQLRALGLSLEPPAPRRRGRLSMVTGTALIATAYLSQMRTGTRSPHI